MVPMVCFISAAQNRVYFTKAAWLCVAKPVICKHQKDRFGEQITIPRRAVCMLGDAARYGGV